MDRNQGLRLRSCTIDLQRRLVKTGDRTATLTELEVNVLSFLSKRPNTPVSTDELLTRVWGYREGIATGTVKTTISRLRKKIESNPANPTHLLTIRGGGYEFVPLEGKVTSHRPRTNLPADVTRFIGREPELAVIQKLLDGGDRLISLLGPPGVGKTRLGLRFAQNVRELRGWDVWFCDLTEARTAEGLVRVAANALGATIPNDLNTDDSVDQLGRTIADRGATLLLLDNFEQLVSSSAWVVARWLQEAPSLRVAVTSRERLNVAAERAVDIPPMSQDEAVELFMERARSIAADVQEDDDDVIAEITQTLNGLPLAIELAASRVHVLSPQALLERLSHGFELLTTQRRDLSPRQATLEGALDWSWQLMNAAERETFAQLSVFRGGFFLDSAEAVLDMSEADQEMTALESVQALRDKSLLHVRRVNHGQIRFGIYESIRSFGQRKLNELDQEEAVRDRHARWAMEVAEGLAARLEGPKAPGALADLDLELPNFESALEWSLDRNREVSARIYLGIDPLFARRGPARRRQELVERVMQNTDQIPLVYRCGLRQCHGLTAHLFGDVRGAREAFDLALADAEELGDLESQSEILRTMGRVLQVYGHMAEAIEATERALAISEEAGNIGWQCRCLNTLGECYSRIEGAQDQAEDYLERGRVLAEGHRHVDVLGYILRRLGVLQFQQGRLFEAERNLVKAAEAHSEVENRRGLGMTHEMLGHLYLFDGRLDESIVAYRGALEWVNSIGERRNIGSVMFSLGYALWKSGELTDAEDMMRDGISNVLPTKAFSHAIKLAPLAGAIAQQGRTREATQTYARARRLLQSIALSPVRQLEFDLWEGHVDLAQAMAAETGDLRDTWLQAVSRRLSEARTFLDPAQNRDAPAVASADILETMNFLEERLDQTKKALAN